MALCQVKRSSDGELDKVLAGNGKESLAYNSLLEAVNRISGEDITPLRERFKSWEGKHIRDVNDPKELALAMYKQLYSPAFKQFFGDWTNYLHSDQGGTFSPRKEENVSKNNLHFGTVIKASNGKTFIIGNTGSKEITGDDYLALSEDGLSSEDYIAPTIYDLYPVGIRQDKFYTDLTEKEGPLFGAQISDLRQYKVIGESKQDLDAYRKATAKIFRGRTDENGEPIITNGEILGENGKKMSILYSINSNPQIGNTYQQTGSPKTTPSKASPSTLKKISEFAARIGVDIHLIKEIKVNGQKIGANGLADPLKGLIDIVKGKQDVALPEEAMHMAVEMIEQKNPALFKQMMSSIGNYHLFNQVVQDYKDIKDYQLPDGKPDINKLKKETIGKVLAQTIIDRNEDSNEKPELLARTRTWWEKIVDFLKQLFLRAHMNPFEEVAESIIQGKENLGEILDLNKNDSGIFLQRDELTDKLKNVNQNLSKVGDKYELDGTPVKNTVFDRVADYLKRRFRNITFTEVRQKEREFKQETEGKFKDDVKDILTRYVDDDGNLKQFPDDQSNPSAVNPYDSTYYSTLESSISDRLNTYPSGTKFYKSINVYDNINTAGTVDLLAVLPDGKVDILQYKAPILPKNATDIPLYVQETYNIEIEGLRSILQKGYGVDRKDFRQTRAIPIKVTYDFKVAGQPTSGLKVARMNIGNINVNLVTDDTLLPVPSPSETTGNKRFDELLTRLRGLVQKLADERVTPDKRLEKTQGISSLLASIRKLQIQGKADGVLSSGRTVVKRQQEKYEQLKTKIDTTDPKVATLEELNKIASDIEADRDQVELYSQLYGIFDEVFNDGSDQSKRYLKEARDISDDAQRSLGKFWRMAVDFRTKKMAAAVDIIDDFRPEKNISAYARLVRSLSQSPIKAGAILWKIVNNINNRFQLEFQDRYKATKELKGRVGEWMKGKDLKQLYSKIFQITPDGKWNGKVIQKFDKKFYEDLRQAKEKGDLRWVRANIDVEAYQLHFLEEHRKRVADSRTARVHENDEENRIRILQQLTEFVNTFSINKSKGVNPNNYMLNEFPLEDKWKSTAYRELEKPENEPVFDLYKHWVDRLKESLETGMIDDHNGWSWFPNVRKNLLEKLTTGKSDRKFISLLNNLRIETEDASFGKIDPLTGKSIDELHANYVHDLSEWVKDADGNYWRDFGEKSMDLFKVMALWDREIIKYSLKAESESLAKLLAYTEAGQSEELSKKSIKTGRTGKVLRNQDTGKLILSTNEINAKYIKDHIDSVWYGKNLSDESDISFSIPYKAAVEKINKLFGRELLTVPEEENINISGVKALDSLNRFFVTKTLGLNVFTSISNLFGGSVNSFINQGLYMTKKDLGAAELEYVSGRFWGSEQSKKTAGLIKYLHPYLEDKTMEEARHLSVSKAVRALSSDHLFYLQRGSDNWVNEVIAISFINNTMIDDGKLVNIREFARKELGHSAKWSGTYEEGLAFDKKLEARVEELKKSPLALLNHAIILDDQISIPGIERMSPTVIALRQSMLQFVKDALGNTSREDLSLYKRSVMWQSFFMFKNWIPRMLDVRGQSLKFDPGSEKYEWGRVRMLGRAVYSLAANKTTSLLKTMLTANSKDLVTVAKDIYKEKQKYFAEQEQDFDMSEGEFVDMFIKGVRSEFKELLLAAGLMSLLVAARLLSPDKKDDPKLKGFYKWMLRGLDKVQDEVSFFYNPASFTDIVNGSVFPGVGMLVDIQKFLRTGIAKGYYHMIGDDKAENRQKMAKYVFKILPVTKELMTYVAIFNDDIAKEYGIKISSQNGSSR